LLQVAEQQDLVQDDVSVSWACMAVVMQARTIIEINFFINLYTIKIKD